MPTDIMPRPDLREDWDPPRRSSRHARPPRTSWVRAELAGRPRLLATILGCGVLAFLVGGFAAAPTTYEAPRPTASTTPSRSQVVTPPVVATGAPATGTEPTSGPATMAPVRTVAHHPTSVATPRPTVSRARPTVRPTRVEPTRPRRTHTSAPPVRTKTPTPPIPDVP